MFDDVDDLVRLKPSVLQRRLCRLDKFIEEYPNSMAEWQQLRTQLQANAIEQYMDLKALWSNIDREFRKYSIEIMDAIRRFCDAAYLTWQRNTWFIDRFFAPADIRERLERYLRRSFFRRPKPLNKYLEMYQQAEGKWQLCSPATQATIRQVIAEIGPRRYQTVSPMIDALVVAVECSSALGNGEWLDDWSRWKRGWARGSNYLRRHCRPLPTWQFPLKKKLHGRSLDEEALTKAHGERQDIVTALARIDLEAAELREKHGFSDKTIAAAALAYFQQTTNLADKLRRLMLQELRDQSLCPYCNGPIGDTPELDHIHPQSHGGFSVRNNLVFSCSNCNNKKSDSTLLEFADLMGEVDPKRWTRKRIG